MVELVLVEIDWNDEPKQNASHHTISSAVESECTADSYSHEGYLERTQARVDKTVEMVGRLLTALHDKGLFDDDAILAVIGGRYKVKP